MLNVVLVEPEIPANTGNVGRTCVLCGARLHLVGPLGFSLGERELRRAGLAYWESLDVVTYADWDDFVARNPLVREQLAETERPAPTRPGGATRDRAATEQVAAGGSDAAPGSGAAKRAAWEPRVHLLTKAGGRTYSDSRYHEGDYLVFGKESAGLSRTLLHGHAELTERIPMRGDDALGNADSWHETFGRLHPELERDVCGNYVDPRTSVVTSLNLSNSVAIVLYEAERQLGFADMRP
ncbi:MAG: tRNA (cytidine(34)-2'-O)-methyltransferase [Atopobiaceae bacterium]|uniref:Putative tRNA (cytidine(34)-2'-O)-methyltransferase n=1 Tax=Olsenella absiana TaxID=3115222 RepID=A0ABU7R942_9ACTN|nr:tRNA (cytidine(34)-2'-O)-methyltransferase [Olsenella sp.]MDY3900104.1 tRNA (cytidine(34)-2'-O)-methyltransferase [Atopobiaceae bacterium]